MNKIKFNQLTDESKIFKMTSLLLVSATKDPDAETAKQIMEQHEKFLNLADLVKDKLASVDMSLKIQRIGSFFKLNLFQLADISRTILAYYFGELKLEDMPAVLAKEIPIDMAKAQEISRMVIQKIINDNSVEEASQAKLAQMTVADALKSYPEVGEQLITSEKIVLKNFPGPVRPCLKNWLADFTFTLGRDKHTAMDRGIYLFQSANGKRLNSQDRNKLAFVLKAFDEGLPVSVNRDTRQIVFAPSQPETQNLKPEAQNPRLTPLIAPSSAPSPVASRHPLPKLGEENNESLHSEDIHNMVRFSSPQKLPYEKTAPVKTDGVKPNDIKPEKSDRFKVSPFHYNLVSGIVDDSEKEKEELQNKGNHINRKNMVDLRE